MPKLVRRWFNLLVSTKIPLSAFKEVMGAIKTGNPVDTICIGLDVELISLVDRPSAFPNSSEQSSGG